MRSTCHVRESVQWRNWRDLGLLLEQGLQFPGSTTKSEYYIRIRVSLSVDGDRRRGGSRATGLDVATQGAHLMGLGCGSYVRG